MEVIIKVISEDGVGELAQLKWRQTWGPEGTSSEGTEKVSCGAPRCRDRGEPAFCAGWLV